ncbi:MAG: cytochrome P450 [Leptolyngbyaceae cyanobacterium bins.349]|nr:cytochrome P450 [Leptolyngbyaceae cyanobacterium bins.349]
MSSSLPPGNTGLPIVGETWQFIADRDFVKTRYEQHGPIFKSRILGRNSVFMVGPEAAEFVLSSGMEYLSWREGWPLTFKALLGRSLFVQEGEEHRRNRKLMMPAFHGMALAKYVATINAITEHYLQKWETLGEFVWYDEFKQLTFDIASQIFLGTPPGEDTAQLSRLFTQLTNGLFGAGFLNALKARKQLLAHLTTVIQEKQHHPGDDALSLLIQAVDEHGDRLSLPEIRDQALLLLFAGHETTTAMLTWICLELARHPQCLEQARLEQTQFLASAPTLEEIGKMPYLDQVLSEIERFHPPVGGGFRGVIKPFEFKGYHVPKGWLLQYSILHTHRLSSVYNHPDQFDPDRFSPERQEAKPQPYHLIGFGGGPRICIGLAFAKLEMKLVMARLLREYQWEILPDQRLDPVIIPTRRPKDGLQVRFRKAHNEAK